MPVRGIQDAKRRTRKLAARIAGPMSERALTTVLIVAQGFATLETPAEYGNLRNSQYRIVRPYSGGLRGRIGYTANYAAAVHGAKGTLRGKPRASGNGNYWDPAGKPRFLARAFEGANLQGINDTVRRTMKL